MSPTMPTIYIPHGGGPCFFMDWTLGPADTWDKMAAWLRGLAQDIGQRPSAILSITAHWESNNEVRVSSAAQPGMLYDYYGFPAHTYELQYPAPGSPELADEVAHMLGTAGIPCRQDSRRGFDHGTFVPLLLIYPQADIPVVQLSLRADLDPAFHLRLGEALAPLRQQGVLLLGSGMSYHNLRKLMRGEDALQASAQFDDWLTESCTLEAASRKQRLIHWADAPAARDAHPREEHLLPLMVVAGAAEENGEKMFSDEVMGARVSAFRFG